MKKIKQWSYSTLKTYRQCPRKVKLAKIDGIREPGSIHTERGERIHKLAEDYVTGKLSELPEELALFEEKFKKLKTMDVACEEEWAFTSAWARTEWKSPDAWVRLKMDAYYFFTENGVFKAHIIDYKTGKIYEDNKKQLSFYAMVFMLRMRLVDQVVASLWYLDSGEEHTEVFTREELPDMFDAWEDAAHPMLTDTKFAPRPGFYCKFCHYAKSKNGNCEFGA